MQVERGDLSGVVLDGRYKVLEPVAEGAMGIVYRAERVKLGRVVAIKVLHDELPNELSSRRRFEIEAKAMAKLEHPHCAAVLDVGIHDDRPFVVMDFVSGQNLKEILAGGPLPIPRAAEILRQVLSGLAHAHEHGIVHRDIKPANIVLSQKAGLGDHVKILDFGLARVSQDSSITTGIVVGTPSYMAPEQIRGVVIDARADLYACGVLLFELLTGKKPFHSEKDDPIEVCSMHLKQPPPRLADMRPGVDFGELETVVAKALTKTPEERFASAVEFAAALDAAVPRRGVATPPAGVPVTVGAQASAPVSAASVPSGAHIPTLSGVMPVEDSLSIPQASAATPPPSGPAIAPQPAMPAPSAPAMPAPSAPAMPAQPAPAMPAPSAPAMSAPSAPAMSAPSAPAMHAPPPPPTQPASAFAPTEPNAPLARARGAISPKHLALGGGVLLALIVVIAIVASGGDDKPAAKPADDAAAATEPVLEPDPVADIVLRANGLAEDGRREAALDLVLSSKKAHPGDARLAFTAGKLFFTKLWWNDGLKQFREAIKLDPAYRTDPELIRIVLKGFNTTPGRDPALATFLLKDIGEAAIPALEETARDHPSPKIRDRAATELKRFR